MSGKLKFFVLLFCLVTFNVSFAQSDFWRDDITRWLNQGEDLRRSNDMEGADACYEKVYDIIESDKDKILQNDGLDYYRVKPLWFVGLGYRDMGLATQESYYYSKAVRAFSKMAELYMQIEGERSTEYADALHDVGSTYYTMKDYSNAAVCFDKELNILLDSLDVFNSEFETLYEDLGICYYETENFEEAVRYFERELVILKREYGEDDDSLIDVLDLLGECYEELKQFDKAKQAYEKLLSIYAVEIGDTNEYYADYLSYYAGCCYSLGEFNEAKEAYLLSIAIMDTIDDEVHHWYSAVTMNGLTICLYKLGEYENAIYWMDRRLSELQKTNGRESATINDIAFKGLCYFEMKEFQKAVEVFLQTLDIEKEQGAEDSYLLTLYQIAACYSMMEKYSLAIQYYEEALSLIKPIRETSDAEYIACLRKIGNAYRSMGDYDKAINYLTRALELSKVVHGDNNNFYALILNDLGMCYLDINELDNSIELFKNVLDITQNSTIYNNLSEAYKEMGDYQHAVFYLDEALKLLGDSLVKKNNAALLNDVEIKRAKSYCSIINNLGSIFIYSGEYDKAIVCYEEVYNTEVEFYGQRHSAVTTTLNNLSVAYSRNGEYERALEYGQKTLEILHELYGDDHPRIATTLSNMALDYIAMNNYEEAKTYLLHALEMNKRIFGEDHAFQYDNVYYNLGNLYHGLGMKKEMSDCFIRYSQIIKEEVEEKFSYLTNKERAFYWNKYNWFFTSNMPSYANMLRDDSDFICATYDGLLFSKGLLLNAETGLRDLILDSGDEESQGLFDRLQYCRNLVAKEYEKPIADRLNVDSLEILSNTLEKDLQKRFASYGELNRNLNVDWKQVQSRLGTNDLAIEFLEVSLSSDSSYYCALTLKKDYKSPHFVELFTASNMNDIDLYDLVWKPLETELDGVENVYFCPAGELYWLPIEYANNGQGSLNERLNLYRLTSSRQIVAKKQRPEIKNAVVYGGLNYDMGIEGLVVEDRTSAEDRGVVVTDYSVAGLEGTLVEANSIYTMLKEAKIDVSLVVGENGTESSFKDLSGHDVSLLHVATHGFYWTKQDASEVGEILERYDLMMYNDYELGPSQEDYDLSRSAILFSGANNALREGYMAMEGVEDGILSAKEIANMNLRGTDLVVLSACQTGLGEISGEGVAGLQRGFKMAGVNTLLMSLWNVDDQATQILMAEFYRNYVVGESKTTALKLAQKKVKETPGFEDPKYWAAFVLLDGIDD